MLTLKNAGKLTCLLGLSALSLFATAQDFKLKILHTNDLHAHVESSRVSGVTVGGYTRLATAILNLRKENPNNILLDGGDTFQGTMYFNTYEGLADLSFMNLIGYNAMCAGNHEFDRGVTPFATFIKNARFPVLAANLDLSKEPALETILKKSTVLDVNGEKVGVVGAITPDLPNISSPGENIKMLDYVSSVQKAVDELTGQGVNKIILLTHSGYDFDKESATKMRGIDVIVGGHSHTLLGNVNIPNFNGSRGGYPTIVKDRAGQNVLIVQAWEWGKAIGNLDVTFDAKGAITEYGGNPVLIDESFPEDPYVKAMVAALRKPIEALSSQKISELKTPLVRSLGTTAEPTMGYVISDAALNATKAQGATMAFWNSGGVRAALEPGNITYGQLIEVCPFGNGLVVLDVTGDELIRALEHGASSSGLLIPSKGFSYTINESNPAGKKVSNATFNGTAIDLKKTYRITINSFVAAGGDSHTVLKEAKGYRLDTGFVDLDALIDYFKTNNPVSMTNEGRIKVVR